MSDEEIVDESTTVELVSVSEETVLEVDEVTQEVVVADEPVLLEVSPDQVVELVPPAGPGPKGDPGEQGDSGEFSTTWRGAWDPATAYLDGDLVEHAGSSWLATQDTVAGDEPGVSAKWDLVAREGAQGPKGDKGDKGDPGDKGDKGDPGFFWEGAWVAQAYPKDSVVHHTNDTWVALNNTASTDEPGVDPIWELVAPRSEVVRNARRVDTGPGLIGGGDLSQDREHQVDLGEGMEFDVNGAIRAFLGAGLLFDASQRIQSRLGSGLEFDVNEAIQVLLGAGVRFGAGGELDADLGTGLEFDVNGAIQTDSTVTRTTYAYHYDEPVPMFGEEILVPSNVRERLVWASIATNGGVTQASSVNAQVETGIGTGVFVNVGVRWRSPSSASGQTSSGTFVVPRGRKYRFVEDETGGSRTFVQYGFKDEVDS